MKLWFALVLFGVVELCTAARILFLVPMPARSHYNLVERLSEELVKKGHELTLLAPFKRSKPIQNLTEIIIPDAGPAINHVAGGNTPGGKFNMRHMNPLHFLAFGSLGETITDLTMNHKPVKDFLNSDQKFDLVLGECFLMEGMLAGFAHRFKAPIVGLATFMPSTWANEMVGNPAPSSYIPEPILGFSEKMTFYERLLNFLYSTLAEFLHYVKHLPSQDKLMRKHFGEDLPPLKDMITKASLVLVNHHHSLGFPRAYLPNMVEIGGYHVKPPKPLPKDLKKFMDEAKDGVIFFSMGSNLHSSEFPKEKFDGILKIFSKLKQRILWKFEAENPPNLPSNVKISKWLPQSDILAHPNVKLFITHGGLLSFTETVLRGVPFVGVPIFGDQAFNMKQAEKFGIGVSLRYEDIGEPAMYDAIMKVLNDPVYAKNIKHRSQLLQDVPMPQIETAVYWLEYVIRHKGARHLISGAQDLAWHELHLLDVFAVLGGIVLVFCYTSLYIVKCVWRTLWGKKNKQTSLSKKRN